MSKQNANKNGLIQRWVQVKDPSGRVHMEARWVAVTQAAQRPVAHPAA